MAIKSCVEQKEEEILVVVKANAVENPRAMMIHLKNAHSADSAVVTAVWFILMAPLAMTPVSSALLFHGIEDTSINIFTVIDPFGAIGYASRVHMYTANVAEDEKQCDDVKYYPLPPTTELRIMVSQLRRYTQLQQPEQVAEHIAAVEGENDATNEGHWQPFRWFCEA